MSETERSTRTQILEAAKAEFLEKGYRNAALRNISRRAGVTTGALYGYFANKEELFRALVGEQYEHLLELYRSILREFFSLPPEQQRTGMMDCTARGMVRMTDYIYSHHDVFKLILCCADGTEYDNLVHEMAELDVGATHDFAQTNQDLGVPLKPVNANLEHILISGMFSTYFELVIHDIPRAEAEEYIRQLLDFYGAGWAKIMGF